MPMLPLKPLSAAVLALVCALGPASAQTTRVRGTIETAEPGRLQVRTAEGSVLNVQLAPNLPIGHRVRADAGALHPQDYVGVAAVPRRPDELQAVEVFVFPPESRGVGEGHRPFDLLPESTMTNATLAETVTAADGTALHLTYKGGEKTIRLTPETRFFTFAQGTPADLKPGLKVSMAVQPSGDQVVASRVTVDDP